MLFLTARRRTVWVLAVPQCVERVLQRALLPLMAACYEGDKLTQAYGQLAE
jgi:hypothetical protein